MARSELVWSQPRESGVGGRTAFGMYASGDYQFARRWYAGARYDHSGRASDASTVDTGGAFYLTYWPSEFNQVRVSVLGMYFSVRFDLPTGATIVCTFGLVLVIMAVCKPIVARLQHG